MEVSVQDGLMTWASSQKRWGIFQVLAGQPQHQQTVERGIGSANGQRQRSQQETEAGLHEDQSHQWVTNGHTAVMGHCCREKTFQTTKNQHRAGLGEAAHKLTCWFCVWMFTSIWGIVVVLQPMSVKDRWERKKCLGVWRWESKLTARMRSRFPRMGTRYTDRKSPKRRGCSSGPSVNPKRRSSENSVWFLGFM